jgi:hydrogenase maturation protein HypF
MPKLARPTQSVADSVAPDNSRLGVMLAYTPLHLLLLQRLRQITGAEPVLVMTSANPRDEPIIGDDRELAPRLGSVYNLALTHDRPIANRCDDSVVLDGRNNGSALIRRARGYAPQPVALAPMFHVKQPVLAVGAEWKNCFCLASGGRAYLSPHIGSVATEQGERLWRDALARYQSWTGIKPKAIACDLHPDYLSTRLAEQLASGLGLPLIRVQHHFAHVLSVLAESGAAGPVLGVACDGTGYGSDGATWGCEFLLVGQDLAWSRVGMLDSLRLADAGAETADPHRTGQAYLAQSQEPGGGPGVYPRRVSCSSLGRLFDAAAGITAICRHATYDAEAAVALESRADPKETADWFSPELLNFTLSPARIDPRPVIRQVSRETTAGAPVSAVAARFQNTLVRLISHFALGLCHRHGTKTVALSGGSFQNQRLLAGVGTRLGQAGLAVLANRLVPANDAGIALGQVVATQPSADDSGRRKTA